MTMRIATIAYGIGIMVVSAILHYVVQPGIDNCNSMAGIVSTYTSQDYSIGCHTLSNIQIGSLASGFGGIGIVICGVIRKSKIR